MDLVLFGIQGSGKGTQAKRLAEEFGYDIFEAGGELRAIAASGSELGDVVKSYIDVGDLVPHEIIMKVVKEAIAQRPADQQILFDGIPRDLDQMYDFNEIMEEMDREFICVEIKLDRETATERIKQRAAEQGRIDDADEEIIEKRMKTFFDKTKLVIDFYEAASQLKMIDGDADVDSVYDTLVSTLKLT